MKLALSAALLTACATTDDGAVDLPSWEEYRAAATRNVNGGTIYVLGGDMRVDEKILRLSYDELIAALESSAKGVASTEQHSTVMTVNGADDLWNATQRQNLTYCVDNGWGADKQRVINEMAAATAAWEAVANINFTYVSSQDGNCGSAPSGVVFSVRRQASGGGCAFFPSAQGQQSCEGTRVLTYSLDLSDFVDISPNVTTTGILRHELGHVLGLRHEHIRNNAPCNGETFSSARALTAYDSKSVMHYPWCGGTNTGDLDITALDITGIVQLYGSPGGPAAVCGNGTVESGEQCDDGNTTSGDGCSSTCQTETAGQTTDTKSGSVARNKFVHLAPYSVKPGTSFKAVMTGTGDPDLYVRWNSQSTTTAFDCRPFVSGASETCTLTVPANATRAYVSVRGYTAATYSVTTTYTKP